jgi:hypothetical protein
MNKDASTKQSTVGACNVKEDLEVESDLQIYREGVSLIGCQNSLCVLQPPSPFALHLQVQRPFV